MTDFARLAIEIDTRQTTQAATELDKLSASGKKVEATTKGVEREWVKASSEAGRLRLEELSLAMQSEKLAKAQQGVGKSASDMARRAQEAAAGLGRANASAGAMRAGATQLSYQIGDVATQFALGARPMQIFAAQGTQVVGALSLMRGTAGGLVGFLAGPWGIALTAAATVVGTLVTQLLDAEDAAKDVEFASYALSDAQGVLGSVMDLTTGKINTQSDALLGLAKAQAIAGQIQAQARQAEARGALQEEARLRRVFQGGFGGGLSFSSPTRSAGGDIADALLDGSLNTQEAVSGLESLRKTGTLTEAQFLDLAKAVTSFGVETENIKVFEELEKALNGDTEAVQVFLRETKNASKQRKDALTAEEKALKARSDEAERFIASLELEVAKIGKTPAEIRQLEIARAKDAAATDAQRAAMDKLNVSRERELKAVEAQKAAEKNRDIETQLQRQRAELDLLRLTGTEREKMALILAEQAEVEAVLVQIMEAERAGNTALAEQLRERIRLIQQTYAVSREGLDIADQAKESAEKLQLVNDELRQMIGLLGNLGAAGSVIGGLLGIVTGNVSAVGGPIGELLNIRTGVTTDQNGSIIARTIGDELRDIFGGENSPFVKSMQSALQGAGTGLIAANALGFTGTGSQIGSAIGGALGETLGEEFLSKGLESIASGLGGAAGPLGAIAGGLLGGALGSLLSSTPRGSATIGNVGGALGVTGTRGTSQARIAASEKSAGAIIDSLDALAAELGATIDPTSGSVSIGIRKGNYRVDTTGSGITKTKNGAVDFGQDAEAAALFAMQDLIRDGVLVGLRKGTENLLKNASDLEVGVQKALAFEGVFTELKALQDPLGSALDTLDKEFTRLRDIFEEAGATAEEYAQLEELLTIKRQDAIDDSIQRQIDDLSQRNDLEVELLRLLGREEEALTQAREYELAAMEGTLRPLQSLIYQLQDANAIIAQFAPLSDDLKAFRNELLGGGNDAASVGFLATRFRSTASLASQGDADALGQLRGTASDFLEAARDNASSALEYQRAVGEVLGAVDSGIFAADAQIEYAQLTIDAIDANREELLQVRRELATTQQQIVENTSALRRLWERYDGDGLTIKSDQDTPIFIKTAPGDTVTTA